MYRIIHRFLFVLTVFVDRGKSGSIFEDCNCNIAYINIFIHSVLDLLVYKQVAIVSVCHEAIRASKPWRIWSALDNPKSFNNNYYYFTFL